MKTLREPVIPASTTDERIVASSIAESIHPVGPSLVRWLVPTLTLGVF